ncbi:hypothetical protein HS125_17730 [bacterium]|nr:hypothetical protein [bacterium]
MKQHAAAIDRAALLSGIVFALLLSLGATASAGEWDWTPYLQFRLSYSDNILLGADGAEVEARKLSHVGDAEIDDVIWEALFGSRATYTVNDHWRVRMRYQYLAEFYTDEDDENTEHHDLNVANELNLSEAWLWRVGFDGAKQNYLPGAEYLLTDYWNYSPFTGLDWKIDDNDTLKGRFTYHWRDYEPLGDSPFHDYQGPETDLVWQHVWPAQSYWRTDLGINWINRDYDQDPLDEHGARKGGSDREDDRVHLRAALTHAWSEDTAGRLGYDFEINDSNGEFYQYDEHQISAVLLRNFHFWEGLQGKLYTHFRWRDYDHQVAQKVLDPKVPTLADDGVREDEQWYINAGLSRNFIERLNVALDYSFLTNSSNDYSSEYDENLVWMTLRWEW